MAKKVFISGASGSMGSETLKQVMASKQNFNSIILLRDKPTNRKLADKLQKQYGDRIEIIFGDMANYDDCVKCIKDADYVFHVAAIIPPTSDHNPKAAEKTNFYGTKCIVDAVKNSPRANEIKFVTIASVALYGNRNYKHPWGRVGDPLLVSAYDFYACTKLRAERYVLEADLPNWVILRQSGILHKNFFKNNMGDGLMFHTCWNVPIEWVTDRDSGLLMQHLVEFDAEGTLAPEFWQKCYNIGGGASCRVTGYETFDEGFKIMGASTEQFFKPNWNADHNFHCFWYYDSDDLEKHLKFQTESCEVYWKRMAKANWYFKLGAPLPKSLLSKLTIQKLFKNSNAPMYWLEHGIEGRINAFFGGREAYNKIPSDWKDYPVFCKGQTPDGPVDYNAVKDIKNAKPYLLDHGYDESKPDSELDIADMQSAAAFRGGKCLSESMTKGDLYTKLKWQCHDGHVFESSPYTILKAGHWCPECCQPTPWQFDKLAKSIPFFAQVWYDTHSKDEDNYYDKDCYKDILGEDK